MEFDEMRKIWNEQNSGYLYAIDEQALQRRVIRKNLEIRRMANVTEIGLMVIIIGVGLFYIVDGISQQEYYQIPEAALFFCIAGYILWTREKRRSLERNADTVLEQLDQSLQLLDYLIRRQRNFIWWYILPLTLIGILNASLHTGEKKWWGIPLLLLAYAIAHILAQKELKCKLLPKRENLIALKKLLEEDVDR